MDADKLLYEQFLKGEIPAFEELVLKHKDNLIYFLQRYIRDVYICEDIAQEAFAHIYVYPENYNFKAGFKTYLYTIARNKAVDYIRKTKKEISTQEAFLEEQFQCDVADKLIAEEATRLVHKAILKLKPQYQQALHLCDFEGMSYNDAAAIMKKTVPQFKILLFRARKSLKNLLEKEGYVYAE